ncbi:MAG TPA: PocR ligand-binding domain-containing protein [Myxococcales bacterium]|jgi:PAS domain S-box-containing protein
MADGKLVAPRLVAERLIPAEQVQSLIDDFYALTRLGIGLIDLDGKVLVAAGWQDVCVRFFRAHPETCRHCQESDLFLTRDLQPGEVREHRCQNGMWDLGTPVYVLGTHLANIFLGQFFYEDEVPDYAFFEGLAQRHGFDWPQFRAALDRAPRWSRERVRTAMRFYTKLADMVAGLSSAHALKQQALDHIGARHTMLREILDAIPELVYWRRRDGLYLGCNDAFARSVGLPGPEAVAGRADGELPWPRAWAKREGDDDEAVMASGTLRRQSVEEVRRRDGTTFVAECTRVPLRDAAGNVHGLLGLVQDVTALVSSEEKLRLLLDSTGEAIYGIDLEGRCTFCNSTCLKMLGYSSAADLIGRDMHRQIHHSRPDGTPFPAEECRTVQAFRRGQGSHVEDEVLFRADGTGFPAEYWSHPQVKDGKVVGAVVTFVDISARKQLEEQLRQSQKIESVGRLAGGVAHDFNNMLGIILGHAELALGQLGPASPVREDLEEISRAAKRSADLTRQLLAFARKQTIAPRILDVNAAVSSQLRLIRRLIGEDIELVWRPAQALWNLEIDPAQLDQLVTNLTTNARDAISGVGQITIETANLALDRGFCARHPGSVAGDYVLLSVSDDGCGIEPERMSRLFDPFYTTKEVGRGTGLGLSMVDGIVKQNGGFVEVVSEAGRGSTFRIYLPRATGAAPPIAVPEVGAQGGQETVLVVEDEESSLRLLERYLTSLGYRVLATSDPEEALEIARKNARVDLLLTDVVMPKMNGRQLADTLCAAIPGLRCLFMSGYTANVIADRGVLDEGVSFLAKPYTLGELAAKVREVLEAR